MSYFVGAYWIARTETRSDCAARVVTFLRELTSLDSSLAQWFKKPASRKSRLVTIPLDPVTLAPMLKSSLRDIDGESIPELGFSLSGWNGKEGSMAASVAFTCGASSASIRNHAVLTFDPAASPSMELLQAALRAAVVAFEPIDAVVNDSRALSVHADVPVWLAPSITHYKAGVGFVDGRPT